MSEIAMVSSRKSRLETSAKKGDKASKKALELANHPSKFLSTVQIGITLIGILMGIYSGDNIEDDVVAYLSQFEMLNPYKETIAVVFILIILTFFSIVLGELVPKRVGLAMPEGVAKFMAYPMYLISLLAAPFIWLLTFSTEFIFKIFRIKSSTQNITEEEIKAIIAEGTKGGAIQEIEQDIVQRVFNLGDRKVSSLMTHRIDTLFLKEDYDPLSVRREVNKEMHSVYPVLNNKGEISGMVYLKDLFKNINDPQFTLTNFIKYPQYISENKSAYEALKLFKSSKVFHALVIDEYGQIQGMVTMNDLLEALVGDVSEFYETEFTFIQRQDGSWLIDGQYPLQEFLQRFGLTHLADRYSYDTVSGLIFHELKRIPSAGDKLQWLNYEIEIMDMDGKRIDKILVKKMN